MKTGESVTDSQGTTWTVGQELGRGTFARSFVARSDDGREAVIKVAHDAAELFGDDADALAEACNTIIDEQAQWMRERRHPWLPLLIDAVTLPSGAHTLLVPRYAATLDVRLRAGAALGDFLGTLVTVAAHCGRGVHGNLRPTNVLLGPDDEVVLCDPITPTFEAHLPRLLARGPGRVTTHPPEATGSPSVAWDTYAICLALFQAASLAPPGPDGRRDDPPLLPRDGLDKIALATVKDRVQARLQQEQANARFAGRVSDKLGAVLNRGLSPQASPSPPYRFNSAADLEGRLSEVHELVDPTVVAVGKVLLAPAARDGIFDGGSLATFSTTVTCTNGVSHEDLATGLMVRDLDAEGDDRVPVPDTRYTVKPHPTGRLRFDFTLPELRPGRYTVRVAFTVKDSGHDPQVADGHFEIRPPPGYVPPDDEPSVETAALRFPGPVQGYTEPHPSLDSLAPHDPPAAFPTPIAPSEPGLLGPDEHRDNPTLSPVPTDPSEPDAQPRPGIATLPSPGTGPGLSPLPSIAPSNPSIPTPSSAQYAASIPSFATPPPADDVEQTEAAPAPNQPAWGGAGAWESLPGVDDPPAHGSPDLLPTPEGMEDLPGFDGGSGASTGLGQLVDQVVALVRDNTWIALGAVIGLLIALLVLAGLAIQLFSG